MLGGIGGRPIEVDVCEGDGSPETAINCANGFVSNNVPIVIDAVDQSMGAAVPILGSANIPIVGTLAARSSPTLRSTERRSTSPDRCRSLR